MITKKSKHGFTLYSFNTFCKNCINCCIVSRFIVRHRKTVNIKFKRLIWFNRLSITVKVIRKKLLIISIYNNYCVNRKFSLLRQITWNQMKACNKSIFNIGHCDTNEKKTKKKLYDVSLFTDK